MSISRIYQPVQLTVGTILRIDEKASHHLARVLRAEIGDVVTVFNGTGGEFEAIITCISKKVVEVELKKFSARNVESPLKICLAQGIAKGEKMDFIVQKAAELGVEKIVPLITEHCNVRLDETREKKRLAHWQAVAISACEQSGRNIVPKIVSPVPYQEWVIAKPAKYRFLLSPHTEKKLANESIEQNAEIAVVIGPEGGLSQQEIYLAEQEGFSSLNLGPRILRTETAALAAITFLQTLYGDMKI